MTSRRPKVLFVCPCWPVDMAYGGQLRALHIGRALKQFGNVTLLIVNAGPVTPESVERTAAEFNLAEEVKALRVTNQSFTQRLKWVLDPRHQNIHGFLATEAEQARVSGLYANSDVVWFLKLRTANILNKWCWPRSVMDIDDVPSTFAHSVRLRSTTAAGWLKATAYLWIYRRRERLLRERFTVVSVCSLQDKIHLGFSEGVHVIPNGFERPAAVADRARATPPRIGFIGLYNYPPNSEGVQWFVKHCWPTIKNTIPGVRLRLVGTDSDGPLKPNDPAIDGLGWIEDSANEIASWSLMIVPIQTGAGTRIKIVDGFSRKCPVVSTRFGALGYEVEDGRELILADDPRGFADACILLIRDYDKATAMAERAFKKFIEKWTWDAIAPKVWAAADDCVRRSSISGSR